MQPKFFLPQVQEAQVTTKFERLEKKEHGTLEKIIYFEDNFYSKMTRIMERISFKLKLTKGSNVGSTESERGF